MNYRKSIGFLYLKARGDKFPAVYNNIKKSTELRDFENVGNKSLSEILKHCKNNVPYYKNILDSVDDIELRKGDPIGIIKKIPSLTKDIIRRHFQDLQSKDLYERIWYFNTSGGSTGEPIRLIQDREYQDRANAVTHLYYWLVGHDIGKAMVKLWGSERDILEGSVGIRAKITNYFWNIKLMNAFRMTPEKMKQYLFLLDSSPPDLVLAYAQSIYELALFAERNGIREVAAIGCEHPGSGGLWVAPWGCYVEIVDEYDNPVPPGVEGDILVTSLINFAMPLIRYKIGDRGVLSPDSTTPSGLRGQILLKVSGRNVDMFKCRDGTLIDGEYFTHLLYFRDWVRKFQFIQKDFDLVAVNMVKTGEDVPDNDLEDISRKIQVLLGKGCRVEYNFVEDIFPSPSGKYRYTISEVEFN